MFVAVCVRGSPAADSGAGCIHCMVEERPPVRQLLGCSSSGSAGGHMHTSHTHTYTHACTCAFLCTHTHILFRRLTSIIHTPCLTLLTCVRIYTFCYVGLHLTVALQRVCKVSSLLLFVFFFSALISILPCLKVSFLYSL